MKAQVSVEFVIMVGIGLVLAAPFVIEANDMMINLETDTDSAELHSDLSDLEDVGDRVASSPIHTREHAEVRIQNDVEIHELDEALIFEQDQGGRVTNHTVIFDDEIDADLPESRGLYRIKVERKTDQLELSHEEVS